MNLQKWYPVTRLRSFFFVTMMIWLIVSSMRIFPYYLSYFNEFCGGPSKGHFFLSDSNLSWGQGQKELGRYISKEKIGDFKFFSSFGNQAEHNYYKIEYQPWETQDFYIPSEGIYIIDVFDLHNIIMSDKEKFLFFKLVEPREIIANIFWLYEIRYKGETPKDFLRKCWMSNEENGYLFWGLRGRTRELFNRSYGSSHLVWKNY